MTSPYAGSAGYYPIGRVAYPPQLADALVGALGLDGSGVLLDVGCGPGSLTLLLAPLCAEAIGVDPDPGMLGEAARLAAERHIHNVSWRRLRGEDLPADLPRPRLVTFAQSFHWMDRHHVAAIIRRMLAPGGAVVHVGATTHEGIEPDRALPHPRPPRRDIARLLQRYLGPERAGRGVPNPDPPAGGPASAEPASAAESVSAGSASSAESGSAKSKSVESESGSAKSWSAESGSAESAKSGRAGSAASSSGSDQSESRASYNGQREDDIFRAAGFQGPQRLEIPGRVVERTVDEVAASVYSLSTSAPHLFGERFSEFDRELRQLLAGAGADGVFSEQMRPIGLSIWR